MATVDTVQGAVDANELRTTLIHEHVRFHDEAVEAQWPRCYDRGEQMSAGVEAVRAAAERGVQTIVDPTAMFGGRDVRFMREVAEATGVRIVACTGIYTYDFLPHYFLTRSVEQMAEHFIADIRDGIQGTGIRAAFLKCACDEPGMTENIEKVHRAVAQASVETGAPIMAHSRPASDTAPRQLEIFEEEGVPLSRVQVAHAGDSDDPDYIERLIDRGVYVGLDRYGIEMFLPMDRRNATTVALLRRGHAGRIFLAADFTPTIDWFAPEAAEMLLEHGAVRPDWSMTLVFEQVLPFLREQGVFDDDVFQTLYVENPRRWLAGE